MATSAMSHPIGESLSVGRPPTDAGRLDVCRRPGGAPVMRQQWGGLGFFHWRADAGDIARRLPRGLHVDLFDGSAWLGVVPFFMRRVRPVWLPPVPWLSWFLELNVRTYVYDDAGRAGVWFFSLDCDQPVAVELARRWFHLPYHHASMRAARDGDGFVDYRCRRIGGYDPVGCRYPVADPALCKPAEQGTLEWFLLERYLLFACDGCGRLASGRVHHQPYRAMSVPPDAGTLAGTLAWNNLAAPAGPPLSAMVAETVDVEVFPLRWLH